MLTVAPPVSSGSRLLRTCWGRLPKSSTRCDELDAFDGDKLAACSLDPRDGLVRILDHCRHVMGVGVHDAVGIARDRDMALPEQEIAPSSFAHSDGSSGSPSEVCCMSLSRRHAMPAALSEICTRPEQSIPRWLLPPQR